MGTSCLNLSIDPDEERELGALPLQIDIALAAGSDVAGSCARAFGHDGRPRPWPGLDGAARRLVDHVLREQESHYCCAEPPALLVQWSRADDAIPENLDALLARRLEELTASWRREAEQRRAEAPEPGVVSRTLDAILGPLLARLVEKPASAGPEPPAPAAVAQALHDVTGAVLTLLAGVHFQQGRYHAQCTWWGSDETISRLRELLRDRLAPFGSAPD